MEFKEDPSQMSVQNLSVNYDAAGRCASIILPDSVLSGTIPIVVIDNSNWFRGNGDYVLSTTESVNKESSTTLAKKVDLVCPDLYDASLNKWEEPITIQVVSSETGSLHERFNIWMEKSDSTLKGYSRWMLRSDKSTTMQIKDGALNLNVYGDRADLNLLASMFIFESAGLEVQCSSRDKGDIVSSFAEFRG